MNLLAKCRNCGKPIHALVDGPRIGWVHIQTDKYACYPDYPMAEPEDEADAA